MRRRAGGRAGGRAGRAGGRAGGQGAGGGNKRQRARRRGAHHDDVLVVRGELLDRADEDVEALVEGQLLLERLDRVAGAPVRGLDLDHLQLVLQEVALRRWERAEGGGRGRLGVRKSGRKRSRGESVSCAGSHPLVVGPPRAPIRRSAAFTLHRALRRVEPSKSAKSLERRATRAPWVLGPRQQRRPLKNAVGPPPRGRRRAALPPGAAAAAAGPLHCLSASQLQRAQFNRAHALRA